MDYQNALDKIEELKTLILKLEKNYTLDEFESIKNNFSSCFKNEKDKIIKELDELFNEGMICNDIKLVLKRIFEKIKNSIMINSDLNILIQANSVSYLLIALKQNNFLKSNYYNSEFNLSSDIREIFNQVDIDNQGCLLMILYTILLMPKEIFFQNFKTDFISLADFMDNEQSIKITSTNNKKIKKEDYIRHLRNSIAHSSVSFIPNESVTFSDSHKGKSVVTIEIPLNKIPDILSILFEILKKFMLKMQNINLY